MLNMKYDDILKRLEKSKFRNSFHLNKRMKEYVLDKGLDEIKKHAYQFVNTRLRAKYIKNDGKQTPTRQVHPVFIAQHACACCCRSCLYKWHKIEKNKELNKEEIDYIVNLIMQWIKKEM